MESFREFEVRALHALVDPVLGASTLRAILADAPSVAFETSGVGYFLTIRHAALPRERIVCQAPVVIGRCAHAECGFVAFLEDHALTLECHGWGSNHFPAGFRDLDVLVEVT